MAHKVLVTKNMAAKGIAWLRERGYEVDVIVTTDEASLQQAIVDYDGVLASVDPYTRDVLTAAKKLKVIARHGVGYDSIDLAAASELGIWVCNTPVANSNAVAEHALALILALAKYVVYFDDDVRRGGWGDDRASHMSVELAGKTLGVVGFGNIGRIVARKAALGLDMKVLAYDPFLPDDRFPAEVKRVGDMAEVFAAADFVTLHLPSTDQTRGSINAKLLKTMRSSAFLINCARGDVVNEDDLHAALASGAIAGAGLDVFTREPTDRNNPLLTLPNVIVMPHTASNTPEAMDAMGLDAARGIDEVLRGKTPTWPVNRPKI
ncbi:MAG: hydroxyacid dehydrogenase [Planctomycetes bacterium]|nr:hydroxyacid dehydrogenase [Planctomycetota bacterium]